MDPGQSNLPTASIGWSPSVLAPQHVIVGVGEQKILTWPLVTHFIAIALLALNCDQIECWQEKLVSSVHFHFLLPCPKLVFLVLKTEKQEDIG